MRTRLTRLLGAVAVVFAVAAAGAGTAQAAEPVVVGSCATTVQGAPGTSVALSPSAVVQPIVDIVRAVPLLGPGIANQLKPVFTALPPIPIGAIPTGTGVITGGEIANRVVAELNRIPLLGPVLSLVVGTVQSTLTQLCGVTVTGVNAVVAPVQDGAEVVGDVGEQLGAQLPGLPETKPTPDPGTPPTTGQPGTGQPGGTPGTGTGQPGNGQAGGFTPVGGVGGLDLPLYGSNPFGGNFGRVPLFSYGSLPFAMPGQFSPSPGVRYGGNIPGYRPGYGLPGADTDGVQTAGRAQALPGTGRMGGGVAAPVLLAVLALSCVTGALVRTWVLRRAVA